MEQSESESETGSEEEYHVDNRGHKQSKERLLFGTNENDEDMYVFASPQQPSSKKDPPPRRNSFRRQLSPRSSDMAQTYHNSTVDAEYLHESTSRRPLDVVVGAHTDDEHLFQAMHSPIKQRRDESPEYEKRKPSITVNRDSTMVIDRANDAARKVGFYLDCLLVLNGISFCSFLCP